ncbi:hypothetical protein B0T17DRAFT_264062 [Bombardia bombarda]|uniref:Chitin-binding type-1 domain-containing protein n=1 Tax=Bombardia bombarda TaxID=252184 RepID=A0AA39X0T6_9PEZI|nr:hypothetical protein B0T17DRAFT_264062 [Bombardia bombarda]
MPCQLRFGVLLLMLMSTFQTSLSSASDEAVSTTTSVASPLPTSRDGQCGGGVTCQGSAFGQCCSVSGWCGSTEEHCGIGCVAAFGVCSNPAPSSSQPPASTPIVTATVTVTATALFRTTSTVLLTSTILSTSTVVASSPVGAPSTLTVFKTITAPAGVVTISITAGGNGAVCTETATRRTTATEIVTRTSSTTKTVRETVTRTKTRSDDD